MEFLQVLPSALKVEAAAAETETHKDFRTTDNTRQTTHNTTNSTDNAKILPSGSEGTSCLCVCVCACVEFRVGLLLEFDS